MLLPQAHRPSFPKSVCRTRSQATVDCDPDLHRKHRRIALAADLCRFTSITRTAPVASTSAGPPKALGHGLSASKTSGATPVAGFKMLWARLGETRRSGSRRERVFT